MTLMYWPAREFVAAGVPQGEAAVDVFFVQPTGFLTGSSWLSTMRLVRDHRQGR